MSGGRVELGLGAGWFDDEHSAYGIPFPPLGERFDRLEEQLADHHRAVGHAGRRAFRSTGAHYRLTDSPALPKPVQQPRPPIIIGGDGAEAHPRPGRPLRRRVQPAVRLRRRHRGRSSTGSGAACDDDRPGPGLAASGPTRWCCAAAATTPRWRAGPPPSAGSRRRAARRTGSPAPPPRWSTGSAGTPRRARADLPAGARPRRPGPPRAGRRRGDAEALTRLPDRPVGRAAGRARWAPVPAAFGIAQHGVQPAVPVTVQVGDVRYAVAVQVELDHVGDPVPSRSVTTSVEPSRWWVTIECAPGRAVSGRCRQRVGRRGCRAAEGRAGAGAETPPAGRSPGPGRPRSGRAPPPTERRRRAGRVAVAAHALWFPVDDENNRADEWCGGG